MLYNILKLLYLNIIIISNLQRREILFNEYLSYILKYTSKFNIFEITIIFVSTRVVKTFIFMADTCLLVQFDSI